MERNRWGRTGAALLVLGGLLESGALGVGSFTSPPRTTPLGAILLSGYTSGWLLVGAGLIAIGCSLVDRGRIAAMVAGALALLVGVVEAVQLVGEPLGPAPGFAASSAYAVAVTIAGLRLLSDRTLRRATRWSLAVPAICLIIGVVGDEIPLLRPLLSLPGTIALPWIGTAVAGTLLLRSRREAEVGAPRS